MTPFTIPFFFVWLTTCVQTNTLSTAGSLITDTSQLSWFEGVVKNLIEDEFLFKFELPRWGEGGRHGAQPTRASFAGVFHAAAWRIIKFDSEPLVRAPLAIRAEDIAFAKKYSEGVKRDGANLHKALLFFAVDLEDLGVDPLKAVGKFDSACSRIIGTAKRKE